MDEILNHLVDVFPGILQEFHRMNAWCSKDLDLPQVQVKALFTVNSVGQCSLLDISQALDITPGWASETIDKLVRSGLLERKHGCEDRRQIIISMSKKGEQFFRDIQEKTRKYFLQVLTLLETEQNKKKLLKGFEILSEVATILAQKRKEIE
jgi:DNA-binding MarR family transcriptional regulator